MDHRHWAKPNQFVSEYLSIDNASSLSVQSVIRPQRWGYVNKIIHISRDNLPLLTLFATDVALPQ